MEEQVARGEEDRDAPRGAHTFSLQPCLLQLLLHHVLDVLPLGVPFSHLLDFDLPARAAARLVLGDLDLYVVVGRLVWEGGGTRRDRRHKQHVSRRATLVFDKIVCLECFSNSKPFYMCSRYIFSNNTSQCYQQQ